MLRCSYFPHRFIANKENTEVIHHNEAAHFSLNKKMIYIMLYITIYE